MFLGAFITLFKKLTNLLDYVRLLTTTLISLCRVLPLLGGYPAWQVTGGWFQFGSKEPNRNWMDFVNVTHPRILPMVA
jgi:hypothetical protein